MQISYMIIDSGLIAHPDNGAIRIRRITLRIATAVMPVLKLLANLIRIAQMERGKGAPALIQSGLFHDWGWEPDSTFSIFFFNTKIQTLETNIKAKLATPSSPTRDAIFNGQSLSVSYPSFLQKLLNCLAHHPLNPLSKTSIPYYCLNPTPSRSELR